MDIPEVDNNSLAPTTSASSPTRSLDKTLRRPSQKKLLDDTSSLSVQSVDNDRGSLLRRSVDKGSRRLSRVADKLERSRSNASSDDGRAQSGSRSPGKRFSRLVRRRQKEAVNGDGEPSEGLGLSATGADGSDLRDTLNPSVESFGRSRSINSSLLTDDEDSEPTDRPALVSRPSHTGYLTLSSPLIAAEAVDPSRSEPTSEAAKQEQDVSPIRNTEFRASQPIEGDPVKTARRTSSAARLQSDNKAKPQPSQRDLVQDSSAGSSGTPQALSPALTAARAANKLSLTTTSSNEAPTTVITPPTPVFSSQPRLPSPKRQRDSPKLGSLASGTHRRTRSAIAAPSKSSAAGAPALTPAIEEVRTPSGSLIQPTGQSGFFSSVFSATQNASSQISSFFANNTGPAGARSRSGTGPYQQKVGPAGGEEVILSDSQLANSTQEAQREPQEPAVATLGSGSLTLGHLGISDPASDASMTSKDEPGDDAGVPTSLAKQAALNNKTEEAAVAEAVAAAYTDKSPVVKNRSLAEHADVLNGRPASISSGGVPETINGTPPRSLVNGKEGSVIHRSNSVRSRISERRKKHRNSSAATGSAIAAALGSTHAALAAPAKGPRLTGFAVANQKRNKDFHALFKSVPEDDYLIEDYSAALQREILLHGRLYVSERNVCFSSNIMGYITTLVISFDEVMAMEKKNTAMIFPNAVVLQTLHARNTFASLINREMTYDMLLNIWKMKHPNLKETEFGHKLDTTVAPPKAESEGDSEDEDTEGETDDEEGASFADADRSSVAVSEIAEAPKTANVRNISLVNGGTAASALNGTTSKLPSPDTAMASNPLAVDFPGPTSHAPTECSDKDTHFEKLVCDDTMPAPLGKVYSMMFGPLSAGLMKKFLEEQDSGDIQYEDDKTGMGETTKNFSYSYIKKLNGSIGPKQTKCVVSQALDCFDLEKQVSVTCSTLTPDVPNGNIFVTKTRYCLMWGPNNSTRMLMSSGVEWSGKSWIRGPIEKGAEAGQAQHGKDLIAFIRSHLVSRVSTKGGKVKGKSKRKQTVDSLDSQTAVKKPAAAASKPADWGLFEPLHPVLGPVLDVLGPIANPTVLLGILLLVITILWLRASVRSDGQAVGQGTFMTPQRLAAYEEMWRREESDMWNWLEDRLKLDDLYIQGQGGESPSSQQVVRGRGLQDQMVDAKMDERQVEDAIKITEDKLALLRAVVDRKKPKSKDEL